MRTLRSFFHRLRSLFRKERLDRDLSDELAAHLFRPDALSEFVL
jgi:hypothetical protein